MFLRIYPQKRYTEKLYIFEFIAQYVTPLKPVIFAGPQQSDHTRLPQAVPVACIKTKQTAPSSTRYPWRQIF